MGSTDLVSKPVVSEPAAEDISPLEAFLSRSVIYEKAGAVIPHDLLRFGLYGSILVIASGILALISPSPDAIRQGDFFLVLGSPAADVASVMHAAAIPAIVFGLALLAVDLYLMQGRRSEQWRSAVVAQAALGGVGGVVGVVFIALMLINLVLWIVIVMCVIAVLILLFVGLAAGDG